MSINLITEGTNCLPFEFEVLVEKGKEVFAIGNHAKHNILEPGQMIWTGKYMNVWKLDRLGRSLSHLVKTVKDLVARGVGFQSLQEKIDATTSGGKLIFHIFATLAEFERDIASERTNAGLSAARARGREGGRPKGVDEKKRQAALALKKDLSHSVRDICNLVGISGNTYYKYTHPETSQSAP